MANVFQSYTPAPKVWQTQNASIVLVSGDTESSVLAAATSIQVQFQRSQSIQYPIGGGRASAPIKLYGSPSGTVQIQTLIGPTSNLQAFIQAFSDPCKSFTLEIKSEGRGGMSCGKAVIQALTCSGCTGQSVSYSISAAQQGLSVAQGTFVVSFTGLQWTQQQPNITQR